MSGDSFDVDAAPAHSPARPPIEYPAGRPGGGEGRNRSGEVELKSTRFAGYAAIFDRPDSSGDIVRKGAFARAIATGGKGLPLLWQHDAAKPIGVIETLAEDERGLRIIGRLNDQAAVAREAASLLKERAVDGLSFGYRVRQSIAGANRQLTDLDLVEVSLVTFPMQPLARVHAVETNPNGDEHGL